MGEEVLYSDSNLGGTIGDEYYSKEELMAMDAIPNDDESGLDRKSSERDAGSREQNRRRGRAAISGLRNYPYKGPKEKRKPSYPY